VTGANNVTGEDNVTDNVTGVNNVTGEDVTDNVTGVIMRHALQPCMKIISLLRKNEVKKLFLFIKKTNIRDEI